MTEVSNSREDDNLLRVLLITHSFPFGKGEPFVGEELTTLARKMEIFLLPFNQQGPERETPSSVKIIRKSNRAFFKVIWALSKNFPVLLSELFQAFPYSFHPRGLLVCLGRYIRACCLVPTIVDTCNSTKIDVIYSYWLSFEALGAIWANQLLREPKFLISRSHRHDLYHYANKPPYCFFQRYLVNFLDRIVAISENGADYLGAAYPNSKHKIAVKKLGTAKRRSSPISNDGVLRIASCSSIIPLKRVSMIAKSLEYFDFPVHWIHFGSGPGMNEIQWFKTELEEKGKIVELPGYKEKDSILSYYESNPVDLFINVSTSEGLPVSVMEAMSSGISIMATSVGGTPEIVGYKAGCGFLLSADITEKDLAESIRSFYNLPMEMKMQEREKTLSFWSENLNMDKNFLKFYEWLDQETSASKNNPVD